jgi:hypothetical protein
LLQERLIFVGLGQAGNNIVREFENLGYNAYYINTSTEDLEQIDTDMSLKYNIPNSGGCAKDRKLAQQYTAKYYNQMMNLIDNKYPTSDIVFVVYSLGGGTGGGTSNMLIDIMSQTNTHKKYNVITVLPDEYESILIQKNAFESLKELTALESVRSIYLLDNAKVNDKMDINIQIATLFDGILNANNSDSRGCFDTVEIERSITQKGISVLAEIEAGEDLKVSMAKSLQESIFATWINDSKILGYTINARNKKEEISFKDALYDNFGIPLVDFTGFNANANTNIVVAAGMSFNNSILNELANRFNTKMEAKKKQASTIEESNITLDDIELDNVKQTVTQRPKKADKPKLADILAKYNTK